MRRLAEPDQQSARIAPARTFPKQAAARVQPARPRPPKPVPKPVESPRPAVAAAPVISPAPAPPPRRDGVYRPYGGGQYWMGWDDGVKRIQGLHALAERFGAKPYTQLLSPNHTWQTERVFFRDVDTGATLVRLTSDPWADELNYFGKSWSADGKDVLFRRRPGMWEASTATHGPMVVRSDGTGLRNVLRDYQLVRRQSCSPTKPNLCFGLADNKHIVAFDLRTGKVDRVLREVLGCWHLKVSLDGKYLLGLSERKTGGLGLWVLSEDGKELHEFPLPAAIHDSYQFHPSQKKVMFWYEGKFSEGFVQWDFENNTTTKVPVSFDWNHGDVGPGRGVHTDGYITRIRGNTWLRPEFLFHLPGVEYYDDPYTYNGYVAWSPRDQLWAYGTRLVRPPRLAEINAFHAEPVPGDVVNRYRICYTGVTTRACLDNPAASPDGTKVLFNSDMFGSMSVYYVVARLPEPPQALRGERHGDSVQLRWRPPAHHAEIAGYHVYRSRESGVGYVPITSRPLAAPELTVPAGNAGEPAFYAVSTVEHSGLESGLSEEAAVDDAAGTPRCVFVEAEQGVRDRRMWIAYEGAASDLHYVWMRSNEGEGRLSLPVHCPQTGKPWVVWARVKGEKGVLFRLASTGGPLTLKAPPTGAWSWVKFDRALDDPSGRPLEITSSLYGSAIDCLALTTDPAFVPGQKPRVRWPSLGPAQGARASAESPYAVRLSWPPVRGDTLHHYNLYCGRSPDFPANQSTLVASPDQCSFLDWGLRPGTTYYYRLRCVDRAGNEGPASAPVRVSTPPVDRVVLDRPPAREVVFDIPHKGVYALWLKIARSPQGGEYFNIKIDGKQVATWTIAFDGHSDESWFSYDQWARFPLDPGRHTFTLDNQTHHIVQQVLLTSDLSHRPEGHVSLLRGW